MLKLLAHPSQRIALAVAVSVILHGLVLWLPEIHLPKHEKELPPLVAKLVPLPKANAKLVRKAKPRPKAKPQAAAPMPIAASAVAAASEELAASGVIPASAPAIADSLAAASAVPPVEPPLQDEPAPPGEQRPPLPKQARLKFNVYQGQQNFKVGESEHELEINDGHYTLSASVHTTGLASIIKSYRMVQTSSGRATQQTLKPEVFTEEITDSSGKQTNRADFDWAHHTIRFSQGGEAKLPLQAQDILSILYQFPAMHEQEDSIVINIGTGKKFEKYLFEIVYEESLDTPMGTLQTVHFRKQRGTNEEGLEIWFAQEYRLLPVKVRYLDRTGAVAAEAIITDIRVSDE